MRRKRNATGGRRWCCSRTLPATMTMPSRKRRPKSCASPTRAARRALSRSRRRRARSSGSTARARPPSPGTPTRSRSTRTWSFRFRASATTPTASNASTSSCRCATSWTSATNWRRGSRVPCSTMRGRPTAMRGRRRRSSPPSWTRRPNWSRPRARAGRTCSTASTRRFPSCRSTGIVASWKRELKAPLEEMFAGLAFAPVMARINDAHAQVLRSRVFVALHMHAGDGNVHTNIPVNSDDYGMLREANAAVARIMRLARALGGVISGEHGIGITKLEYLTDAELQPFADYKQRIDPEGRFNRGKLLRDPRLPADLSGAYTPSFSLIGHESLILEQSAIGGIADSIKDCLRCGKCKPVCATHVPRANLLYSPRNKILATSLLIEAFLYEEQTRRGVSLKHFNAFGDVADHCTVCHKCVNPCPVDIDFGDVSIAMRNLLRKMGTRNFNPGHGGVDVLSQCDEPRDDQADQESDDRLGLQGAAPGSSHRQGGRIGAGTDAASAADRRQASDQGADHPLHQQADAGRAAQADVAGAARHRGRRGRADHPGSGARGRGRRSSVLLPRLRVGTAVLAGGTGDAGDALSRGRPDGAAARGTCAAGIRRPRRATTTRARRSRRPTACCSIGWRTRSTISTSRR